MDMNELISSDNWFEFKGIKKIIPKQSKRVKEANLDLKSYGYQICHFY